MMRWLQTYRPWVNVFAPLAMLFVVAALPVSGCTTTEAGATCVGGVERDDGSCEPKCDPAKCIEDNVCVDNHCQVQCSSHDDCWFGVQSCTVTTTDDGLPVQVCLPNGRQPTVDNTTGWPGGGYGTSCPFGDEQCGMKACTTTGLECDPQACGGQPDLCEVDQVACQGFADGECNVGLCKGSEETCEDGACSGSGRPCGGNLDCRRCTVTTCDPAQCTDFTCLGDEAGAGNANAYCTHDDCLDNSQCPAGYYCGVIRDPHDICGPTCNGSSCSDDGSPCSGDGDCQKGNSNFCGTTTEPCLDLGQLQAQGLQYSEGSVCLLRNTCLQRGECAPCDDNVDCSIGGADVCINHGGDNVCARFCAEQPDCRGDESCVYYGKTCLASPTVDCGTPEDCPAPGDQCVDRSACVPASGSCTASNAQGSKFCHHCVQDSDCGPVDSSWACLQATIGENACFDLSFPDTCNTDADCPQAPSGKNGECLDEPEGLSPGDQVYHHCYLPLADIAQRFSCWQN